MKKDYRCRHNPQDVNSLCEQLIIQGAGSLSNNELLAVLLHTSNQHENLLLLSDRILAHYDGLQGLAQTAPTDLQRIGGVEDAQVAQIYAALELGKRLTTYDLNQRPSIYKASDAVALLQDMSALVQEHVRVIMLDMNRRLLGIHTVYIGTLNASVLRVSEIFREAVIRNSPAIILAHNHPSGDPSPSPEDVEITRVLTAAGSHLDISVLDHIIIGQSGWASLRDMGLVFRD
jgi:DNA repair protein RadC